MAKKLSGWKTRGMNRDLSVSAFNPEFAFENMNLRLATNNGNTAMSWVTEKGTSELRISYEPRPWYDADSYTVIYGTCVGTAVLNNKLVLFTTLDELEQDTGYKDFIYVFWYNDDQKLELDGKLLFAGNLGLSMEHPLETLVSYESEHIQKVYWTDGINQPRLINIANEDTERYGNTSFDFITTLQLNETIKVKKILGGGGMFAPGVIQYCFTYYNKYGQESNIFYTTPLYYISHQDRGGSPEDKIDNAFRISIEKVDRNFDFLRIYSIQRTSINAVPLCKRVQDIAIEGLDETSSGSGIYKASYIDTGLNGDTIDPMELLYKGGNVINVGTMEQKDNTLFMGDITTPQNELPVIDPQNPITLEVGERKFFPLMISTDNYEYSSQLTAFKAVEENGEYVKTEESVPCAGFKYGDFYRCGVQFQDETGKWTDPIFIDDKEIVEEAQEPEELEEVQEEEEPVEPLHAPYITTNMQEEEIYEMGITVEVANNSSNPITINPEAHIVIEVATSPEPETRRIDGEGGETVYKAQILTVVLGDFSSRTIASQQSETFSNAVVRYGKLYYGASFCTDAGLLASVGKTVNCDLTDAGGDTDTLIMSNVTWDNTTPGQETPCLPSQNPHGYTYIFSCNSSPVPVPPGPGPGPEPPTPEELGEFKYSIGAISDPHYNTVGDNTEYSNDIENAMEYFAGLDNLKFVACGGDMCDEKNGDLVMFTRLWFNKAKVLNGGSWPAGGKTGFQLVTQSPLPLSSMRLHVCLGNHDVRQVYGHTSLGFNDSSTGNKWGSIARLLMEDGTTITWEDEVTSDHDYGTTYAPAWTGDSGAETNRDYSVGDIEECMGYYDDDLYFCGYDDIWAPTAGWGTYNRLLSLSGGWDTRSMRSKKNYYIKLKSDGTQAMPYQVSGQYVDDDNFETLVVFLSADYGLDSNTDECWRFDHPYGVLDTTSGYAKDVEDYVLDNEAILGNQNLYNRTNEGLFNYQFYDCKALLWLESVLRTYSNKRILIFHHHPFPHKAGNGKSEGGTGYYASKNSIRPYHLTGDGKNNSSSGSYQLCGVQFHFLNILNRKYKNTIWFTGHSHLIWEDEQYDSYLNFCNKEFDYRIPTAADAAIDYNGSSNVPAFYTRTSDTATEETGWNVHLPSLSRPKTLANGSEQKLPFASEGAVIEVYEHGVLIKPIIFKENSSGQGGTYVNRIYGDGQIILDTQTAALRSSTPNIARRSGNLSLERSNMQNSLSREALNIDPIPTIESVMVTVPVIKGTIPAEVAEDLISSGYKKARAVVVYPDMQSRKVLCQGVGCPTLYTANHREKSLAESTGDLWAQSSWFFRPKNLSSYEYLEDVNTPPSEDLTNLEYMVRDGSPLNIKRVEIQGHYAANNKFTVDWTTLTFHSPDIEFDDNMANLDYASDALDYTNVGEASFLRTFSDIDIQTETPTISNKGAGFVKKSFVKNRAYGIISGLFWDDYEVDDDVSSDEDNMASPFTAFTWQKAPMKWLVYLWNRTGSLNNDMERPADSGVQSAVLKRKIISNLRFANTNWITPSSAKSYKSSLFYSDQPEILKLDIGNPNKANVYMGNIDTLLVSDEMDGMYFALSGDAVDYSRHYSSPSFNSEVRWGTFEGSDGSQGNRWYDDNGNWFPGDSTREVYKFMTSVGNIYKDIVLKKCSVRMKYKSTPHVVMIQRGDGSIYSSVSENTLPVFELGRNISIDPEDENYFPVFGGRSKDALMANVWIPCGEPVNLENTDGDGDTQGPVEFEYSWGDTYYQRWDCLKTYAFTPEDINQVVEIGSFMLETRVNIDGRYDRNRGQLSNLYMSPRNFNLINPVYSQLNNFFTYRIQDDDAYNEKKYPNQITWSKTKTSGADVDLWTNVTLASVLEMDGDKGKVRKLARLNNNLICFQDKGIAQVLYNDRVQINTQDGVPIEISNSDKVQGKNYISDSIGCSNKWSMAQTPSGIYFMDSINKAIFMFNGQLSNLSGSLGFNSWCKNNIPASEAEWNPQFPLYNGKSAFMACYDKQNQDVLFVNNETALAYSEKLQAFTSFYDYGASPFFCSLNDTGIWLRNPYSYTVEEEGQEPVEIDVPEMLWKHQAGDYCNFFGVNKPYWMTLVGNPEPQMDKIFTNLEFRACVEGDGELNSQTGKFTPALPFDSLETWDEYQHGYTELKNLSGHSSFMHHNGNDSSLKRKFRIWRCDIPRDNVDVNATVENPMGIYRKAKHPIDRMRNPWLYLKLKKESQESMDKAEIHDIVMTYFD